MRTADTPGPAGQPPERPGQPPGTAEPAPGTAPEHELPVVVQRLWGDAAPRRRGPRPALSAGQIVRAAMDLADAEGLAAVSMSRVAEAVGYTSMALYRHVSGKDELLILMSDAVAADLPDVPTDAGWRAGLEAWTRAQIDLAMTRPWMLDLPISAVPPGPNRVRWIDQAFGVLRDVDLPADEKLAIVGLLAQHVLGEARVHVETRRAAVEKVRRDAKLSDKIPEADLDPAAIEAADPYADFETVLLRYAGPQAYPNLFAAFATWQGGAIDSPTDDDIAFGITVVLDGIDAYLRRRGAIGA